MSDVKFFFDPRCPWCYQTSKWAKRLEAMGEISLDWGVCSLEVLNIEDGRDPLDLVETGSPELRTALVVGDRHGSAAIGRFYTALGARTFEADQPAGDRLQNIRDALVDASLSPDLLDTATADPSTWARVVEETTRLHELVGDVGVPTIVLDGGEGPAIFGPVIVSPPTDEDAVELWRHTEWLARYGNFAELKRKRSGPPDLPLMAWYAEQRRRREAERSGG